MTRTRTRESRLLREAYVEATLACGLRAIVFRKPGFVRKTALVAAAYGSLDTVFDADGSGPKATPAGIAHFLEHQLFKKERGDLLMEYGRTGASANAFTSYTTTTFFFSAPDRFDANLDLLLETVLSPWFSPDAVAKEKLIIEQELRMYNDSPEHRIYRNLMTALYRRHPVREDIGGTVASIQQIDPGLLERCWRTFYHPSNLLFIAAGDLEAEAVFARLEKALAGRDGAVSIRRSLPDEPGGTERDSVVEEAVVSRPQVVLGLKDLRPSREGLLERDLAATVALDLVFGRATDWYAERYESGLIDDSFSCSTMADETFDFTLIGGETDEPERLADEVRRELRRAAKRAFPKGEVERAKRKRLGRYLRAFNAPDEVAFLVHAYAHHGIDPFAVPEAIEGLTARGLAARLRELVDDDNIAVSILKPRGSGSH
jgi:predicted Zn-dependent peptidase